jgi:hypothetical protein
MKNNRILLALTPSNSPNLEQTEKPFFCKKCLNFINLLISDN